MLTYKQESDEMRRQFAKYISKSEPEETRRKIRGLISLLPEEFISLKTKNLEFLKIKLQDQLREKFDLNQENLRCDLYGLSGVGIQFKNSTIKISVRMRNVVEKTRDFVKHVKDTTEQGIYKFLTGN